MKLPRLGVNFYKVVFGVAFSLLWAKVMYTIWRQPSYITFVWFYLALGSILLKWVFFEIIDRIHTKMRLRTVRRELEESDVRVHQAGTDEHQATPRQISVSSEPGMALEERVKALENAVWSLGEVVGTAIQNSLEALKRKDLDLARQVVQDDRHVDLKESAIREDCMRVIAAGSLGADDVREIVSILGIITELERIGDYAEGIANITLMIGDGPFLGLPTDISQMAGRALEMLRDSVQSFLKRDIQKAKGICQADDEVDALYDNTFRELLLSIVREPETVTQATRLIWVAHNLERFADRVTNICEWVVFSVTGQMVDIGASKY